jgi:bifunctional UDP-N-acetylglucosamine pyrophosphorylase/glucosamine-1-phosphate N-acetyltransferase
MASQAARAVLLAAGQGKRMLSARPKVLHDVLGRSIILRILDALDELSLEHVHVVVGHGAEAVKNHLAARNPRTNWSAHLQEPQLGTGDALRQVAPSLKEFKGTLLVSVGDTPLLTAATLGNFIETHRRQGAVMSLLTTAVDDAKTYGRIVRDRNGQVQKIVEHKDATEKQKEIKEVNPAIYCFEWPAIEPGLAQLKNDNRQKEYYLTDLLEWCVSSKLKVASLLVEDWREVLGINSRLELAEANSLLRDRVVQRLALEDGVTVVDPATTWVGPEADIGQDCVIMPFSHIMGKVAIGPGCIIGPSAVIAGPVEIGPRSTITQSMVTNCVIGPDCRVGPFAHIREHADIDGNCRIGNFVEVKKSTIGWHTNVSHLSYIGDAILGEKVNIGAGTITANYDHITKQKQRTVIGDGSSTGSNSVLVAPVTIGKESAVAALTCVTKDVPDGALAVGRAKQENREGYVAKKKEKVRAAQVVK